MTETRQLLQFPCRFPVKAFGHDHPNFAATVLEVVQQHAADVTEADLKQSNSRNGRYLAVTVSVNATSQAQLDRIYEALTGHDMVVMAL